MARKPKADDFVDLVRQSLAAGMSLRAAKAHARKILAERDIIIVGPDGKERSAEVGPSIFDERARKPTHKKDGAN